MAKFVLICIRINKDFYCDEKTYTPAGLFEKYLYHFDDSISSGLYRRYLSLFKEGCIYISYAYFSYTFWLFIGSR